MDSFLRFWVYFWGFSSVPTLPFLMPIDSGAVFLLSLQFDPLVLLISRPLHAHFLQWAYFCNVLGFCCNFSFYLDFLRLSLLQAAQKNEGNTKTASRSLVKAMLKLKIFTDTEQNVLTKVQIWNHRPSLFSCVHICLTALSMFLMRQWTVSWGISQNIWQGWHTEAFPLEREQRVQSFWEGFRVEPLLVHIERRNHLNYPCDLAPR